jgi:hypothetical protein
MFTYCRNQTGKIHGFAASPFRRFVAALALDDCSVLLGRSGCAEIALHTARFG